MFFAGSARYLLPMAAPVALLASRLRPRWLAAGFAAQMALGLGLAVVNYQHWDGYRRFAATLRAQAGARAACGSTANGACATTWKPTAGWRCERTSVMYPGDIVVSSELA